MSENQTCYLCKVEKPMEAFITTINDRHYRMCQDCVSGISATRKKSTGTPLKHSATTRTCYLCRQSRPNKEFTRRSTGTYYSACKECNRNVFAQRRRARLLGVGGSYTTAEWSQLKRKHERCPICRRAWAEIPPHPGGGAVITADHIIPASKGGINSIENIQPLCYSCNSKKGAKLKN